MALLVGEVVFPVRIPIRLEVPDQLAREIEDFRKHYGLTLDQFLTSMSENGRIELTAANLKQFIHTH